jgi:hypothetical protein
MRLEADSPTNRAACNDCDTMRGWVAPDPQISPLEAGFHDAVPAELGKIGREGQNTSDELHSCECECRSGRVATKASVATASSSVHFDSPESTLIIVDWDDTLFPTSWMQRNRAFAAWQHGDLDAEALLQQMEDADVKVLRELDSCACALILAANQLGRVACVTLAQRPWVHRCLQDFMPCLWEVFRDLGIQVSYARERCSATRVTSFTDLTPGPRGVSASEMLCRVRAKQVKDDLELHSILVQGELCSQKRRAMFQIIREFYNQSSWKNVLSIGDGPAERDALQDLGLHHTNPICPRSGVQTPFRVKTVKMVEAPDCTSLIAAQQIIQTWLPQVTGHSDDLNLNMDDYDGTCFGQGAKFPVCSFRGLQCYRALVNNVCIACP